MNKDKHSIFYCKDLPWWFVAINIIGVALNLLGWLLTLYFYIGDEMEAQSWIILFAFPLILLAIVAFSFKFFRKKKAYGILLALIPIAFFVVILSLMSDIQC